MESLDVVPAFEAADKGHYLRALAACSDKPRLVVSQPIDSVTGVRLLDAGTRVDLQAIAVLAGHALAAPMDRCICAEVSVTHEDLLELAREQLTAVPILGHFAAGLGAELNRIWAALAACPLPPVLATRLAVARDTAGGLYKHAVRAALVALFIGVWAKVDQSELQSLATAALLHDLGMLDLDPAFLQDERPLSALGRSRLQRHPLIAARIAHGEASLDESIATGIAQHHERLDGSGYPYGLHGAQISPIARVLMLAEIVLAFLEPPYADPALQLSMTLRANHRSLDPQLSQLLLAALPTLSSAGGLMNRSELRRAGAVLAAWRRASAATPVHEAAQFQFVNERMRRVDRLVAEASIRDETESAGAADVCADIAALGREALWHARQIALDAMHRFPPTGSSAIGQDVVGDWIAVAMRLSEPRRGSMLHGEP
jgi:hypothetical protein